jgi:hypothetical protein
MNAPMEHWCDASEQGIELTRSRAYQSNDQAWVELHHPPRSPLQQLLRTGVPSDQESQGLRELRKRCDPVALLATMRSWQSRLALLISGQHASAMAGDPLSWQPPEEEKRELEGFLHGYQVLWR